MQESLQRLFDGEMSFDRFARVSRPAWERLAAHMLRRYRCPDGVQVEDVLQQLLLEAWRAHGKYVERWGAVIKNPEAPMTGPAYLRWAAYTETKHWLNVQRNAARRSDHSPGRYPASWAQVGGERDIGDQVHHDPCSGIEAAAQVAILVERASHDDRILLEECLAVGGEIDGAVLSERFGVPVVTARRKAYRAFERLSAAFAG